jgi:hypothetical protein
MPPANEGRTSTNGRLVSGQESQTLALGWTNRCRAISKTRETRRHDGADRVASYIRLAGIAAAIAIKPCHGLKRTDLKQLTEHVAGWNWPPASIATFISKNALSPIFLDRSGMSKSTSGQNPFSALW